jgi:perosamine synthetase
MISLSEPTFAGRELEYLTECIQSGWVSADGPFGPRFERSVEALLDHEVHATACSSGSAALQIALMALGLTAGELVIVPAISFMATLNPILHLGAEPLILDIEEESLGLSPAAVKEWLEKETVLRGGSRYDRRSGKRVFGIIAASLYGIPCRLEELAAIAKRYDLRLIEDNAEALGARHNGRPTGCFGDAAIISFNGNKTMTAGGGGMVLSRDKAIVDRAASWANQCREPGHAEPIDYGFNFRLSNLQAAVGLAQVERAETLFAKRRQIRSLYQSGLEAMGLSLHAELSGDVPAWWLHLLCVPSSIQPLDIQATLAKEGIQCRTLFTPFGRQALYRDFSQSGCPVAEKMWSSRLALPSSAHLGREDIEIVLGALSRCLSVSPIPVQGS